MTDRIGRPGATVWRPAPPEDWPDLIARIARLWAELHEADRALALDLARKLPDMEGRRGPS